MTNVITLKPKSYWTTERIDEELQRLDMAENGFMPADRLRELLLRVRAVKE